MQVDYNPQTGKRRSVFEGNVDYLVRIEACEKRADGLWLTIRTWKEKKAAVRVRFIGEDTFRFQMFPEGHMGTAKGPGRNVVFGGEKKPAFERICPAELEEEAGAYLYGNGRLTLRFEKNWWEMSVWQDGKALTREQAFDTNVDNRWKGLPTGYRYDDVGDWTETWGYMDLFSDEAFWGFGEKFTDFNKRGRLIRCWQKDALSTNTEDSYKTHPFFISSRGYAVLLNTYTRSSFDMGYSSQAGYRMTAEDGGLDYVVWAARGRDYKGLIARYVKMTGAIPLIPKWAFGFWMSKCSYHDRQEVEETLQRAKDEGMAVDVIHIDNWQKAEYAGLWEWDTKRFPEPKEFIRSLHEKGIRISLWMYPYLKENSPAFGELLRRGYFVRDRQKGAALFYATADDKVRSACFDFTNPDFLRWYEERIQAALDMGVDVIKTDFSEAVPETALYYDGTSGTEGHNRLTWLYAETVYRAMEKHGRKTGSLPMLWCRSGFAGSHSIPAAWAGDSSSAANNHACLLRGGLSLALSGVAFWGFDMGGFYHTGADGNECPPSEEEYIRSMELGFFMPLSRAHGKTPREPWNYTERAKRIAVKYDAYRHSLLPYLYSTACVSHLKGVPMLRALLLEFPQDPCARCQDLTFLLGKSLLIAPPFDRKEYEVYLPVGRWRDCISDKILEGERWITVSPSLEELPVYQRENTILPMRMEANACEAEDASEPLWVDLFFEEDMEEEFYDYVSDGTVKRYVFSAKTGGGNRLYVETDMNIVKIRLFTTLKFACIILNGSKVEEP